MVFMPYPEKGLRMDSTKRDALASLEGRRKAVSVPLAMLIVACAAILGVSLAAVSASASDPPGNYSRTIAGQDTALCAEEGPLSVSHLTHDWSDSEGHATAGDAVRELEASINDAARLTYHAHHVHSNSHPIYDGIVPDPDAPLPKFTEEELNELVDLLQPQRNFRTSVQSSVQHDGGTKSLFDVPSTESGVIEARIVVDTSGGEWRVSEMYACISSLVTDFDRFKELRKKEVAL